MMPMSSNAALWRSLLGPLLDLDEVSFSLGLSEDELRSLVFHHQLLGVPWDGRLVFPAFQFARDGKPYPALEELLEILSGISPLEIGRWFGTPQIDLEDVPPRRWLELGLDPEQLKASAKHHSERLRLERDREYGF